MRSVLLCWGGCGGEFALVICFRQITFFNIYYVNLSVVRNIPLLYQARQQPAKAVSWLKFEPRSQILLQ